MVDYNVRASLCKYKADQKIVERVFEILLLLWLLLLILVLVGVWSFWGRNEEHVDTLVRDLLLVHVSF